MVHLHAPTDPTIPANGGKVTSTKNGCPCVDPSRASTVTTPRFPPPEPWRRSRGRCAMTSGGRSRSAS